MNPGIKKAMNVVSTLIVVLAVILAILLVGVRLVGLQVFTVLSGSMEPEFHTGSLIYVKDVDPFTLKERDIITFMLDENTIATHRIVGVVPDEEDPSVVRFRTKGDANNSEDGTLVHYRNVIGTPVFSIPLLGYLSAYIQEPPGTYVAISVGAILLLLVFLPDLFSDSEEEEKKKKTKENTAANAPARAAVHTGNRPTPQPRPTNPQVRTSDPAGRVANPQARPVNPTPRPTSPRSAAANPVARSVNPQMRAAAPNRPRPSYPAGQTQGSTARPVNPQARPAGSQARPVAPAQRTATAQQNPAPRRIPAQPGVTRRESAAPQVSGGSPSPVRPNSNIPNAEERRNSSL